MRKWILGILLSLAFNNAQAEDRQIKCLALAAFTEAKSEGKHGMALVAHTVMNRAKTRNKTICQVAYARNQYHGVLNWPKGRDPAKLSASMWADALYVAYKVMNNDWPIGKCRGAEYFYAPKVVRRKPQWAYKIPLICSYKGHVFHG